VPGGDNYIFLKKELGLKIYENMSVTLGDKRPSYSTDKKLVARFRTGHVSTESKNVLGYQLKCQFQKIWMLFIPQSWTNEDYLLKR
jgi:hypothetical protein